MSCIKLAFSTIWPMPKKNWPTPGNFDPCQQKLTHAKRNLPTPKKIKPSQKNLPTQKKIEPCQKKLAKAKRFWPIPKKFDPRQKIWHTPKILTHTKKHFDLWQKQFDPMPNQFDPRQNKLTHAEKYLTHTKKFLTHVKNILTRAKKNNKKYPRTYEGTLPVLFSGLSHLKSTRLNLLNCKVSHENKKSTVLKKLLSFWNQRPYFCLIAKFVAKIKILKFGNKNALFGYL